MQNFGVRSEIETLLFICQLPKLIFIFKIFFYEATSYISSCPSDLTVGIPLQFPVLICLNFIYEE